MLPCIVSADLQGSDERRVCDLKDPAGSAKLGKVTSRNVVLVYLDAKILHVDVDAIVVT